jgi:hypothetical protein
MLLADQCSGLKIAESDMDCAVTRTGNKQYHYIAIWKLKHDAAIKSSVLECNSVAPANGNAISDHRLCVSEAIQPMQARMPNIDVAVLSREARPYSG